MPHCLAEHGLKPSGVFIRVGGAPAPAAGGHIRQMIKTPDGEKNFLAKLAACQYSEKNFGIIGDSDMSANLGMLLSDQCPHTEK